ncbi:MULTISPECIES: hypothetical protein [Bacillaceae]|uniref:Uncharacterized protein n=1 Tax=Pseudobacillus wudalianchiensis TaxID=1743143 RepID=A0A1B9ATC5_9BACI|nr:MULTISPECIES: hypothetical protein [Bacillus]KMY53377.1 hypothetical protein AC623_04750 [Bacillus sp. FJAT-27231]OCA87146.1 hypothetical protein A8F95_07710 [Bacillus wudalianchiensis]
MKDEDKQTSEGLNQILEIINAKGDEGELKRIVNQGHEDSLVCSDELFHKDLRAIVDDTMREEE